MLQITLIDGGIRVKEVGKKTRTLIKWPSERHVFPCNQYSYTPPVNLPKIESMYRDLKSEGLQNADIIQKLIRLYVPWYCFHVGHLEIVSIVIGLIGHRGSSKTSSAVYICIFDWLIRGLPVYSNVDIAIKVRYKDCSKVFRSKPWRGVDMLDLDEDCRGGVVLNDEINVGGGAESTRFMSSANLAWASDLQQLRKRQLSVIWTAQSWSTVDNRTRWQSDYVVECIDCFFDKSYAAVCQGDKVKWVVCELSGLSGQFDTAYELEHRNLLHYEIWRGMLWLRPISWPAFDTFKEQADDYIHQYKLKQATVEEEKKVAIITARQQPDRDVVDRLMVDMKESGTDSFFADEFWVSINADKSRQTRIGTMLSEFFDKKRDHSSKRYYYQLKGDGHGR